MTDSPQEIEGWFDYQSLYDKVIAQAKPGATLVEVGCWMGKSIIYLAQGLKSRGWRGRLCAVDNFTGDDSCGRPEGGYLDKFKTNIEAAGVSELIEIVQGDSAESAEKFYNQSCDFVFIDAAHDFASVQRDIAAWLPKVKRGGWIGGHDYDSQGVKEAVDEAFANPMTDGTCWLTRKEEITLSILTPTIPERAAQLVALQDKIQMQIGKLPVEHLVLCDNRKMTIGEKRDALVQSARGQYVAFVDDDDDVSADYVASILQAAEKSPDVITFRQQAEVNGAVGELDFDLGHENEAFIPGGLTHRKPWHVCAWRRNLVSRYHFPPVNYGEDWAWCEQFVDLAKSQAKIDRILHHYRHDAATTAAPMPFDTSSKV